MTEIERLVKLADDMAGSTAKLWCERGVSLALEEAAKGFTDPAYPRAVIIKILRALHPSHGEKPHE